MEVLVFDTPCQALAESQELLGDDDVQDWSGCWLRLKDDQNYGDSLFPIAYKIFHFLHTLFFDWWAQEIGRYYSIHSSVVVEIVALAVGCSKNWAKEVEEYG